MPKQSAGILLYKQTDNRLLVFLVHPGGPFYIKKDNGSWSVPKGEFLDDEDALLAAQREFEEETGQRIAGDFIKLTPIIQKSGKKVYVWAVKGDIDHETIVSNNFEMEWPPRSGKSKSFPEVDRAAWFETDTAKAKILAAQVGLIEELEQILKK